MTLRLKLVLSIALAALLAMLLAAAAIYVQASHQVETEMNAALEAGARVAAKAAAEQQRGSIEPAEARRRLATIVAEFDGYRHLRARLTDAGGTELAVSTVATPELPAPSWFHALVEGDLAPVTVALPTALAGAGTLTLEADSANEAGEAWADAVRTLAILALLLTVTLGIVYVLIGAALRPLEKLARAFAEIPHPDGAMEMAERGPVELARVYQSFNSMLRRLADSEAANRRLTEQLLTVQEEERADIARDLHDEIGPLLFAVDVDAAAIERMASSGRHGEIAPRLAGIRDAVGQLQRHVRGILARLRPAALLDLGLPYALENLLASWHGRHPGITFTLSYGASDVPGEVEATIYRVAQEALSNAVRHGGPSRVEIDVSDQDQGFRITIRNDGRGLVPQHPARSRTDRAARNNHSIAGLGLIGMRERVAQHGGTLTISDLATAPGVVVTAWLPRPTPGPRP